MIDSQPMTLYGFKIFIEDDRPRMQLGAAVKEFLTPEQIADHNAWLRDFFGVENFIKDGEYIVNEMFRMVHMNPRTYEQFVVATRRVSA